MLNLPAPLFAAVRRQHRLPSSVLVAGFIASLLFAAPSYPAQALSSPLLLNDAIHKALENDPWLKGNQQQQKAIEAKALAARSLPSPMMTLGIDNLATDSFEFNQEPMTQLKVGVSQMLPRGNSLYLMNKKLSQKGQALPHQRQDHRRKLILNVRQTWLDAYKAQESLALIADNRILFEQLVDIAQSKYSSAVGATRQQDVVRAQLELTQLDDRVIALQQQQEVSLYRLSELINDGNVQSFYSPIGTESAANKYLIDRTLPQFSPPPISSTNTTALLSQHPAILAVEQHISASQTDIALAEQNYKPQFDLNLSYGYREDAPNGMERADFFSIKVGFDMPVFTDKRQDQELNSAVSTTEFIKTDKWLLLRKLQADLESAQSQLQRLDERQQLYQNRLLPQMRAQSEASLNAYTHDVGDFAEVMRSRIAELNTHIDHLSITVDRQKTIAQLDYFFTAATHNTDLSKNDSTGDEYE